MRKAFTLVELLVVVGIMGMMSTLAIGSYSAVTRGMNDRAALDAARSLVDAALQRANLDRTKTYVYLYDEVGRLETPETAGLVCGLMVAVRPVGRITQVPEAGLFCDEFNDLNQTYKPLDDEDEQASEGEQQQRASTLRLYKLVSGQAAVATVYEGVYSFDVSDADLEDAAGAQRTWTIYGFKKVEGDDGATFAVGDLYGQEFAVTRLPPGYAFSSSVSMSGTADLGQKLVKVIEINPTERSTPSLKIYSLRPSGRFDGIGDINQAKDGEQ